jgi:hypothetical protein
MSWVHLSTASQNKAADAIVDSIDTGTGTTGGTIKIYKNAAPLNANTAADSGNLLVTLTFSSTAFNSASSGQAAAYAITNGTAVATGTATWARILDRDGATIMDVDVGESGTTLVLDTASIITDATVSCTSGTLSMPSGA